MRLKTLLLLTFVAFSVTLIAQENTVIVVNNITKEQTKNDIAQEAYLGVSYNHVTKKKAQQLNFPSKNGVYVTRIKKGSAAESIGLQAFDYLTGMNGQSFTENQSFNKMMDEMRPNQEVTINLIRKGQPMQIQATLIAKPKKTTNLYKDEYAFLGVSPSHDEIPENIQGTRVSTIEPNSTADAMGMKNKDIIQYVNDNPILDWHDLNTAMKNTVKGEDLKVVFYRESEEEAFIKTMPGIRKGESANPSNQVDSEVDSETEVAKVEMENISEEESKEMADADIDMPVVNTLSVENLRLFPNPNNGIFNLNFNLEGEDEVNIRVFSANGQVIYEDNLGEFSGEYLEQINISDNAKGIYFLQVRQGENILSKKIILK